MNALLTNQADVGIQARISVKGKFDWEKTVEEFSKLFNEIINQELNVSE